MQRQQERLIDRVRETNQIMARQQAHQQLRKTGRDMEQATMRVGEMVRNMERLHQDPEFTGSQQRMRQMDQLQVRLQNTMREMKQVQVGLRSMIGTQ